MIERQRSRKRKIRGTSKLQSGFSIIPSLFTIGNIFCGCYSIISVLKNNFDHAALAIGFGYLLDGLDGRIARLTNTASEFGMELDSLADIVTFGVAPAILAFSWGLGAFKGAAGDTVKHITQFGWFATFAFVLCGTLRLARFNVQSKKPSDSSSKRFFVGLPIPAAAGIIAAIVHFGKEPIQVIGSALLWYFLVTIVAFLMISTVRYNSFKEFDMKKPRPRWLFLMLGAWIWAVISYSEWVLLIMAVVFVSSGPIMKLAQFVRRFIPSAVGSTETAHGNIRH